MLVLILVTAVAVADPGEGNHAPESAAAAGAAGVPEPVVPAGSAEAEPAVDPEPARVARVPVDPVAVERGETAQVEAEEHAAAPEPQEPPEPVAPDDAAAPEPLEPAEPAARDDAAAPEPVEPTEPAARDDAAAPEPVEPAEPASPADADDREVVERGDSAKVEAEEHAAAPEPQEPPQPVAPDDAAAPEPDERAEPEDADNAAAIEVTIRPSPAEARKEVVAALEDIGYEPRRTRNGRDIFVSEARWKPRVIVDRDGWMKIARRTCVITNAAGEAADPATSDKALWLPCLLNPAACVSCRGLVAHKKYIDQERRRVAGALHDELEAYSDAIADRSLEHRLAWELPEQLTRIWEQGVDDGGEPIGDVAARHDALLSLWSTRTCTEWGQRARDMIAVWIGVHVQQSEHPISAERLAATVACGEVIDVRRHSE